jgi:hypothetical protein
MDEKPEYFTVVFEGTAKAMKRNPFEIESPFGKVVAIGLGDALNRQDVAVDLLTATTKAATLADHCLNESITTVTIDDRQESVSDLLAEFECAINRAQNAA